MRNPYKRTDVFACYYQAHAKFEHRVSVYHVMKQKQCYPQGCLMFRWHCELKNKGKSCPRKFNYVGRLCEGCTHYEDEKIQYQPRVLLNTTEFEAFKAELEDFDEWLQEHEHRDLNVWCRVHTVKPRFRKTRSGGRGQLLLDGYLIVVRSGFIDITEFDDYFYIHLSPSQQDRLRIAPGDEFEAVGRLKLDHGRLLFPKIWRVEYEHRSGEVTWNNSRALVARQSAEAFSFQPESCIKCPHGALVDVVAMERGQKRLRRQLHCLQGIQDPHDCYIKAFIDTDLCDVYK